MRMKKERGRIAWEGDKGGHRGQRRRREKRAHNDIILPPKKMTGQSMRMMPKKGWGNDGAQAGTQGTTTTMGHRGNDDNDKKGKRVHSVGRTATKEGRRGEAAKGGGKKNEVKVEGGGTMTSRGAFGQNRSRSRPKNRSHRDN